MGANSPTVSGSQFGAMGPITNATLPTFGRPATPTAAPASAKAAGTYAGPGASINILGQPFAWYLGAIILLVGLKVLSEHPKSELNPAFVRIGTYNFMAVGVTASVWILTMKVLFNRWHVPGLTDVANAL